MTGSFLLPVSRVRAVSLRKVVLIFVVAALVASGCGGKKAGEDEVVDDSAPEAVESGLEDAGEVGTGFKGAELDRIMRLLKRIESPESPFDPKPKLLSAWFLSSLWNDRPQVTRLFCVKTCRSRSLSLVTFQR